MTDGYETVVYDLDGTLVELDVDWDTVRAETVGALRARDVDVDDGSLWAVLERAETTGYRRLVHEIIAEHEREGARTSRRLDLADELPLSGPVAVCSLNCEAACRIALELHGLDGYVDAIVGRDTVETVKPEPEPLLHAIAAAGGDPREALFVGDTERDARTAERAGVSFQYVSERTRTDRPQ